ncbi:MAG: dNTP triphosphohydrolase [Desulfovibrio sp.]
MISEAKQTERIESCVKRNDMDYRTPWERDFARIIHSAAFRRLQSKTQIFGLGDSDFYRTRLTHSLEVAQISTAIVNNLKRRFDQTAKQIHIFLPDANLITAIGLAHDLGHPPFGHGGEAALNYCMNRFGGFEGNGQTLRILSKLEKYSTHCGLNPTRRLLLGILKYPGSYSLLSSSDINKIIKKNEGNPIWKVSKELAKPPKCYMDCEEDVVAWMFKPFNKEDKGLYFVQ